MEYVKVDGKALVFSEQRAFKKQLGMTRMHAHSKISVSRYTKAGCGRRSRQLLGTANVALLDERLKMCGISEETFS